MIINNNENQPNIINPGNQPVIQTNQPVQNRQRGTGFTNINRILGANVGAGQQLAGRIGSSILGQGQRVQSNLGEQQQRFQTGFQQARQQALANIASASGLTRQSGESQEDYERRVASQNIDYGNIGSTLRGTSYQGPAGFQNPNLLLSQAQAAQRLGQFTRSGLGQGILARQFAVNRGNYGLGQNALDQLFLTQDPNAQLALQQARQGVSNLSEGVQGASTAAQQMAEGVQSNIEKERADINQKILQSISGIGESGIKSAEIQKKDAERLKELFTQFSQTNPEDRANITLSARDKQLLSNLSKYGINTGESLISTYDPNPNVNVTENILDLLEQATVTGGGGYNLTEEQKAASRNLGTFLGGNTLADQLATSVYDPASLTSVNTGILNASQAQKTTIEGLHQQTGTKTAQDVINKVNDFNTTINSKDSNRYGATPDFDRSTGPSDLADRIREGRVDSGSFIGGAVRLLGPQAVINVIDMVRDQDESFWGGATDEYMNDRIANILQEKLGQAQTSSNQLLNMYQKQTSLQNIINNTFRLPSVSVETPYTQTQTQQNAINNALSQLGNRALYTYGSNRRPFTIEEYRRIFNTPYELGSSDWNKNLRDVEGYIPGGIYGTMSAQTAQELRDALAPYL